MTHYNTTGLSGAELVGARKCSARQDNEVLWFFVRHAGVEYTPCEVHAALGLEGVPLTSIRRSISTLTKSRCLVKTEVRRIGRYGRLTGCWRYIP